MEKQLFVIKEGFSNTYLVHGVAALIIAGFSFYISDYLPFVFTGIAILLFLAVTGVEIDEKNRRYRKYSVICGIKWGRWMEFSENDKVYLMLSIETMTVFPGGHAFPLSVITPTNFYNGNKSKTITYDVIMENEQCVRLIVNDFSRYKDAQSALRSFQRAGCPVRNKVAEKISENRKRRR